MRTSSLIGAFSGVAVMLTTSMVLASPSENAPKPYVAMAGSCRGAGWNQGGWPKGQGYLTAAQCKDRCEQTPGCTSFDLARARKDQFDCFLFGHSGVTGDGGADTCFSTAPATSYALLVGSCRGPGWNEGGWPKGQGYKTLGEAIAACASTPGCTAFDLARPRNGRFDVHLFGHSGVRGDGGADQCFAIRFTDAPLASAKSAPTAAPAFDPGTVIRATGMTCPANYTHVTFAEAKANRDRVCGLLAAWDIAQLADGGSMDGSGYGCKAVQKDPRKLGHSLCKPAAVSPCKVYEGTQCFWMENESGNSCWVPAGALAPDFNACFQADSCDGGGGTSAGGCYKWSNGSTGERTPWPGR